MKFPDFIIAGFSRCGTSALLLNLGQHPDIQIPEINGTESNFWTRPIHQILENIEKYKNFFYGKITGEKTPGYCLRANNMKYIHDYIPDVKIILCLRNPVNKALSHFEMHKRWGRVPKDEVYNFDRHKLVLSEGRYIHYIKNCVLPNIPRENIYFIIMERMKEDLNRCISKLYNFLGADPYKSEIKTEILKDVNQSESHYMKLFKNNSNYQIWSHKYYTDAPDSELKKMYEFFKPHNDELFKYLGYEIKEWRV
jgi:hypothetical protein